MEQHSSHYLYGSPGIVIGRKGAEIERMTEEITRMSGGKQVKIDIQEIKTPELDAQLVPRISPCRSSAYFFSPRDEEGGPNHDGFRGLGIKIRCSGRLGGAEISRAEGIVEGKDSLHTLRTPIDYGFAEANTVYGKIGVKCWICKPEPVADQRTPEKSGVHEPAQASR